MAGGRRDIYAPPCPSHGRSFLASPHDSRGDPQGRESAPLPHPFHLFSELPTLRTVCNHPLNVESKQLKKKSAYFCPRTLTIVWVRETVKSKAISRGVVPPYGDAVHERMNAEFMVSREYNETHA